MNYIVIGLIIWFDAFGFTTHRYYYDIQLFEGSPFVEGKAMLHQAMLSQEYFNVVYIQGKATVVLQETMGEANYYLEETYVRADANRGRNSIQWEGFYQQRDKGLYTILHNPCWSGYWPQSNNRINNFEWKEWRPAQQHLRTSSKVSR